MGVPATALSSAVVIVASSVSRPTNNGLTRSRRIPSCILPVQPSSANPVRLSVSQAAGAAAGHTW